LKINQKYANSYISKRMMKMGKLSGPPISFPEKFYFAKLRVTWYGKFGLLWNFLFGNIPQNVFQDLIQCPIDFCLSYVVLPHNEKGSCPELKDFRVIGQNDFDDPRGR
jgi:hypothetical protein